MLLRIEDASLFLAAAQYGGHPVERVAVGIILLIGIGLILRVINFLLSMAHDRKFHKKLHPFLEQFSDDELRKELARSVFEAWDLKTSENQKSVPGREVLEDVYRQILEKLKDGVEITSVRYASLVAFYGEAVFASMEKTWECEQRRLWIKVLDSEGQIRAELGPAVIVGQGLESRSSSPIEELEMVEMLLEEDRLGIHQKPTGELSMKSWRKS